MPVRTALLGTTIAIAALAAAIGFAASLQFLIDTPRLAGYSWDAGVIGNAFSPQEQTDVVARLERSIRDRLA